MAHERLTEQRVTIDRLLAKSRTFSNLPAFLDFNSQGPVAFYKQISYICMSNKVRQNDFFKYLSITVYILQGCREG